MQTTKSWSDYYKDHTSVRFSNILLHWPYLLSIVSTKPTKILEIGCGPADHTVFLTSFLKKTSFSVLDNDPGIVKWLKEKYQGSLNVLFCDITDTNKIKKLNLKENSFDVVYSQGLMEHFEEKEFKKIIENFLPYAKKTVFSVPSNQYPQKDFGNEILRTKKELETLLSHIPNIKYKVLNYAPDISIRTKIQRIKKHNMQLLPAMQYFVFGTNHYLVELTKK